MQELREDVAIVNTQLHEINGTVQYIRGKFDGKED